MRKFCKPIFFINISQLVYKLLVYTEKVLLLLNLAIESVLSRQKVPEQIWEVATQHLENQAQKTHEGACYLKLSIYYCMIQGRD